MKNFFAGFNKEFLRGLLKSEYILLFLILLTGLLLRLKALTFQSLWLDELISVMSTAPSESLRSIFSHYQVDPHPPLFFLILHYWTMLFGYTEFVARLLPALIGSAGVWAVYLLGKECYNRNTGLIAAAITAVNFFTLYYSQEVRPYIFLFLTAALSFTYFIRLVKRQVRRNAILYGVFTAVMLYAHYYGFFLLLSQLIVLLFFFIFDAERSRLGLLKWFALSGAIMFGLYLPWLPTLWDMLGKESHWITKAPPPDFFVRLFGLFWGNEPYLVILFTGLILMVLFYFVQSKREPATAENLHLNIVVPILFSWVFFALFIPYYRSITLVPMYHPKYAVGMLPALLVLVAMGIEIFKNKIFKLLLIVSILLASYLNLFYHKDYYNRITKAQWRSAVELAVKEKRQKGNIYVLSNDPDKYRFYFQTKKTGIDVLPADVGVLKGILEKDKSDKGFLVLNAESGQKYPANFLAYLEKNFNMVFREDFYIVIGKLWVHKSQDPNALTDAFVQKVLTAPGTREYKVWNGAGEDVKQVSPAFFPLSKWGEFSFEIAKENEVSNEAILTIRNLSPDKDGVRRMNLGYEVNRNGLDMEMPTGKYIHMAVKTAVSPKLINKENYFVISAFDGAWWPSEKVTFTSTDWRTYIISKKIEPGCKRLILVARFAPKSSQEEMKIRDVKIFVTDHPL